MSKIAVTVRAASVAAVLLSCLLVGCRSAERTDAPSVGVSPGPGLSWENIRWQVYNVATDHGSGRVEIGVPVMAVDFFTTPAGRCAQATPMDTLASDYSLQLFGHGADDFTRFCELRIDASGMRELIEAHYDPGEAFFAREGGLRAAKANPILGPHRLMGVIRYDDTCTLLIDYQFAAPEGHSDVSAMGVESFLLANGKWYLVDTDGIDLRRVAAVVTGQDDLRAMFATCREELGLSNPVD